MLCRGWVRPSFRRWLASWNLRRAGVAVVIGSTLGFVGICVANPSAWVLAVAPLLLAWRRERRRLIQLDARAGDDEALPPQQNPESSHFCEPASNACTK